jgi:hypothetical protein
VATNLKEMRNLIKEIVGTLGAVVPRRLRAKHDREREGLHSPGIWDKVRPKIVAARPLKKAELQKRLILPPSRSS